MPKHDDNFVFVAVSAIKQHTQTKRQSGFLTSFPIEFSTRDQRQFEQSKIWKLSKWQRRPWRESDRIQPYEFG
jgi:hypothetical protein